MLAETREQETTMINPSPLHTQICRRAFLTESAYGLGGIALATLLNQQLATETAADQSAPWRGVIKTPHFPVKAKRIIHLCMAGGPSHLETLDWKPELKRLNGQPFPESFTKGQQLAQLQNTELKVRGAFCEFKKSGNAGIEISDLFPKLATVADE